MYASNERPAQPKRSQELQEIVESACVKLIKDNPGTHVVIIMADNQPLPNGKSAVGVTSGGADYFAVAETVKAVARAYSLKL